MALTPDARADHHRWLVELTQLPTAAGREQRVIEWITRWVAERSDLALTTDPAGNLTVSHSRGSADAALYFTAHLDHPAFVVESVIAPSVAHLGFRGGVMDDYFAAARVRIHPRSGPAVGATLTGRPNLGPAVFPAYLAELDRPADLYPGDVATWELPPAEVRDGILHTHACDDLAAVAAALAAFDTLRAEPKHSARLLFTRAEEIGFIGAIAACRNGTMPRNSRLLALENSRSFDDSPIGGGPIVRVGDRMSIFSPALSAAVARRAEDLAGGPPPTAAQKAVTPAWKWQRKLMAGGACEATVFCAAGYEATCLCLPLGNYHNMADLSAVQSATNTAPARVAPEFISLADFDGLVDLLVACGQSLPDAGSVQSRIDKLWNERNFVLADASPLSPQP